MAIQPTSATSRTPSLSQKLRGLGRLKRKSNEKLEREFEVVHTPDRPTRLITPIEAPTEDQCGDDIARWHRASAKVRISIPVRSQYQKTNMDESAIATDSDDDEDGLDRHYATGLVYGQGVGRTHSQQTGLQHTQPANPALQRREGPFGTEPEIHERHVPPFFHGIAKASPAPAPTPAPLFSGTAVWCPPRTSSRQGASPPATSGWHKSVTVPRYTGVRMEIYHRGHCPFCRKYFGDGSLPLNCPYLDCGKDFRAYLEYPNRRYASKAPPRLAQRAFVNTDAQLEVYRPTMPNSQVEVPTATEEQQEPPRHQALLSPSPPLQQRHRGPSPSNTIRTIWPSPLGIYNPEQPTHQTRLNKPEYLEKPLPPPPALSEKRRPPPPSLQSQPRPTTTPRPESSSARHVQPQPRPEPISTRRESISAQPIQPQPRLTTAPRPELSSTRRESFSARRESILNQPIQPQARLATTPQPESFSARRESFSARRESILTRPAQPQPRPTIAPRPESISARRESFPGRRESFLAHRESFPSRRESFPGRRGSFSTRPQSISTRHQQLYTHQQPSTHDQPSTQEQQPRTSYLRTRRASLSSAPPIQPPPSSVSPNNVSTKPSPAPRTAEPALRYRSRDRGGDVDVDRGRDLNRRIRDWSRRTSMDGGRYMDRGRSRARCAGNADTDRTRDQAQDKATKTRRRRSTLVDLVDDDDILAWKGPAGRARFQRERIKSGGDDAELFMDIIGAYENEGEENKGRGQRWV